jgi:hypothetical protein
VGEDAEHVEGVRVVGIGGKDLAVKALGVGKLTRSVEADGDGEGGFWGSWRHPLSNLSV